MIFNTLLTETNKVATKKGEDTDVMKNKYRTDQTTNNKYIFYQRTRRTFTESEHALGHK